METEINSLFSPLSWALGSEEPSTASATCCTVLPEPLSVSSHITIAIQGFHSVKASMMWEASVVTTAHKTQMRFFPVLSTRSPNIGDMGADITYTILPRKYKRYLIKDITAKKQEKNPKVLNSKIPSSFNILLKWSSVNRNIKIFLVFH